ncbi:MAG: hypothetical protein ACYC91_09590 [Solirubrobacteraceae bacterium]
MSRRRRMRRLAGAAGLAVVLVLAVSVVSPHRPPCRAIRAPVHGGRLTALPALQALLQDVPCPGSGRASYATVDDHGAAMDALDPLDDPRGGYLGVYHTPTGSRPGARNPDFEVLLAHSADLIHWHRVAVLDRAYASMPALTAVPGRPGYLLAYEKGLTPVSPHFVRVCWFGSLPGLLRDRPRTTVDLPRRFSAYNNGTPAFLSVRWGGSPARSVIELGFHYQASSGPLAGPDREAVGTLRGFRQWIAVRDLAVDRLLDRDGLSGSHGDRRQFVFAARPWRVYEATTPRPGFAGWHAVLYDPGTDRVYRLRLATATGRFQTSFGNPIVHVLRGPGGRGALLAMTVFVFDSGAAGGEAGELIFGQPL